MIIMVLLTILLVICGRCNVTDENCKMFDKIIFIIYWVLFIWACFIS